MSYFLAEDFDFNDIDASVNQTNVVARLSTELDYKKMFDLLINDKSIFETFQLEIKSEGTSLVAYIHVCWHDALPNGRYRYKVPNWCIIRDDPNKSGAYVISTEKHINGQTTPKGQVDQINALLEFAMKLNTNGFTISEVNVSCEHDKYDIDAYCLSGAYYGRVIRSYIAITDEILNIMPDIVVDHGYFYMQELLFTTEADLIKFMLKVKRKSHEGLVITAGKMNNAFIMRNRPSGRGKMTRYAQKLGTLSVKQLEELLKKVEQKADNADAVDKQECIESTSLVESFDFNDVDASTGHNTTGVLKNAFGIDGFYSEAFKLYKTDIVNKRSGRTHSKFLFLNPRYDDAQTIRDELSFDTFCKQIPMTKIGSDLYSIDVDIISFFFEGRRDFAESMDLISLCGIKFNVKNLEFVFDDNNIAVLNDLAKIGNVFNEVERLDITNANILTMEQGPAVTDYLHVEDTQIVSFKGFNYGPEINDINITFNKINGLRFPKDWTGLPEPGRKYYIRLSTSIFGKDTSANDMAKLLYSLQNFPTFSGCSAENLPDITIQFGSMTKNHESASRSVQQRQWKEHINYLANSGFSNKKDAAKIIRLLTSNISIE